MISVCMATYNGDKFIQQQLDSMLIQLPSDAEIIIADDGSKDATLSVIKSFQDKRIRLLTNGNHLGIIKNFERALKASKGEIIFISDQDDIWLPEKVSKVLDALKNCDLVLHDGYLLKENPKCLLWERRELLSKYRPYKKGVVSNWWKNSFTGCCMAFHRKVLESALPFPKSLPMHDQWIGLVAEKKYKVQYIRSPLIEYRQHLNNATQIQKSKASIFQKIKWRMFLLAILYYFSPSHLD